MASFKDIEKHWAEKDIEWAVKRGLVKGEKQPDNTFLFNPDEPLTRAQICVILHRENLAKNVLSKVLSSVVVIQNFNAGSLGSGTVIKSDSTGCWILTNYHVVDGTPVNGHLDINFNVAPWYAQGSVLVSNQTKDLAVVFVQNDQTLFPTASLTADKISQGDEVIVIGAPLGLTDTVTRGIVSNEDRHIGYIQSDVPIKLIQTDTAINPGNSGGAMFNENAELIGIPCMKLNDIIYKDAQGNTYNMSIECLNFAIHIDEVKDFLAVTNIIL